jgi:(p)ppGpp synthase/HD superfamily hydrolase
MKETVPNVVPGARLTEAFAVACEVHADQSRKGTTIPYVSHLMAVASLVLEHGGDEDVAVAALLHDAPEDRGGRAMLEEIRGRFGERVAGIVEGCTDTFEQKKPAWRERKERYIAHLQRADRDTCVVSAADKLHNARSILHDLRNRAPDVFTRFSATELQTGWYYGRMARVLHQRLAGTEGLALATALFHVVDEIAEHRGAGAFRAGAELGKRGEPCPPRAAALAPMPPSGDGAHA